MTIFVTGRSGTSLVMRALAASLPGPVLAIDLSGPRGGLDIAFGVEHLAGWRWQDIVAAEGEIDLRLLRPRLPAIGRVEVLSQGRRLVEVPMALQEGVVAAAQDSVVQVLVEVLDPLRVAALARPGDRIVVSTGLEVRELGVVAAGLPALADADVTVVAHVRRRESTLAVDEVIDVDVDVVRTDRRAERALAHGIPSPGRGPLARWATRWLARAEAA